MGATFCLFLLSGCGARSRTTIVPEEVPPEEPCDGPDCERLCDERPDSPGCPCAAVEPEVCFFGPPEAAGVGACRSGLMVCWDGSWGVCNGVVLPTAEICNEVDDDCDGQVDEGVLSECGTCGPCPECPCFGARAGCSGWAGAEISGLVETADGDLALESPAPGRWSRNIGTDDMPSWRSLRVTADVPDGAKVVVSLRSLGWFGSDDGPWVELGGWGLEFDPLDTGVVMECDEMGVRVDLLPAPDGATPLLHGVEACWAPAFCDM